MTEFRKMRRTKQYLSDERVEAIMKNSTAGVMAVLGDNDYPYTVPLSYVYEDGRIYFHCGREGHKIDAMRKCSKVSFCVIGEDDVQGEIFTTYFRSVVAFGKVREVEHMSEEFLHAHKILSLKYWPEAPADKLEDALKKDVMPMLVFAIDVEHMTGKQGKDLVGK